MKTYLHILFLLIFCFGFTACSSDDDNGGDEEEEKPFTWNGDWNDPSHPQYEKYKGNYNPIVGDWIDVDDSNNIRFIYKEDFSIERSTFDRTNNKWETKILTDQYQINDIGLRYTYHAGEATEEYKLIVENGQEYLLTRYQLPPREWHKYKRYKE